MELKVRYANSGTNLNNPENFIRFLIILFVFILFAVCPVYANGLPDVPNPVETRLYHGSPEQIIAFIKHQKIIVSAIISEAEKDLTRAAKPADKDTISKAVEVFNGLSFQFHRLLSELKMPRYLSIKPPAIGRAPYSYKILKNVRDFQKKIEQQVRDNTNEIYSLKRKIATIEANLKSMAFVYAGIKKNAPPGRFIAYGKLADIYSLQAEYARLNLKVLRLNDYSGVLQKLKARGADLVKQCLKKIQISSRDLTVADTAMNQAQAKEKSFLKELQKETKLLNSRSIRYELYLENIVEKASNLKQNSAINLLQIEKRRIKTIIETIQIKLKGMKQKKINLAISALNASFKYNWLKQYAGSEKKLPLTEVINTWKSKLEFLNQTKISIIKLFSWSQLEQSRLTEKLILASSDKESASDNKIKSALSTLEKQILKAKQLVDSLILSVADTKNDIAVLSSDINWFLESLGHEMPWYMNVKVYFEKNLSNSLQEVRSVFFYPLFSAGETNITLAFIFQLIFLFITGFLILKLIRRKSAIFLKDKTKLSIGTINSITTLGYYILLVFAVLIILTSVGVDLSQITMLVGALGVGIGFGLQTIANNFISGIILLTEQSVKIDDIIRLENGLTGEVRRIAIRATIIRTVNGNEVIVPNSELVSGRVDSWTYSDNWRRLKIPFGVSYDSDPDEIVKIATEAAREVSGTVENIMHPINVRFIGFGDNSLDFTLRVWRRMTTLRGRQGLLSDYYFVLFRKLKKAGVDIPFPQNVLHLQSVSPEVIEKMKKIFFDPNLAGEHSDNSITNE